MQKGDLHQPPVIGKRLDIPFHIRPAHHVEDQVRPAFRLQLCHEITGPVIDGRLGPKVAADLTFFIGAGGCKDPRAKGTGNLNRRCADTRGAAMHQKPLTRLQSAAHHHVRPDGKAGFRQAGRFTQAHPRRDR